VARKRVSDSTLVNAILFMAVVSFFLGKAALNGEEEQPKKAAA
jgi:hypothetical protein